MNHVFKSDGLWIIPVMLTCWTLRCRASALPGLALRLELPDRCSSDRPAVDLPWWIGTCTRSVTWKHFSWASQWNPSLTFFLGVTFKAKCEMWRECCWLLGCESFKGFFHGTLGFEMFWMAHSRLSTSFCWDQNYGCRNIKRYQEHCCWMFLTKSLLLNAA